MLFPRPVLRAMIVATIAAGLVWTGPVLGRTERPAADRVVGALDNDAPSPEPSPSWEPPPSPSPATEPSPVPTDEPSPSPEPSSSSEPTPGPTPTPPPPPDAWTGRFNLFQPTAWVRQYWSHTCTAASTQTMLNLIHGRTDRSRITQDRIIRYARTHDSLRVSHGSDPLGWANALTYFGAGTYRWRTFATQSAALRYAALRMLATRKPIGLLVWQGRHAWTMTGFTAAADPRTNPTAGISGIYVAPPLVGVDPSPNAYLPRSRLGTFARYRERDGWRVWVNRWVVVAP